jgi:hypothetical protein
MTWKSHSGALFIWTTGS